ncbi:MAG: ribonuclease III, partial [Oscillospiraceae bacterium]|nr:ribonuclease III [Oscillospiraceae bacterium]
QKIGYTFRNPQLLRQAVTHSSYANEGKKHGKNNERLEFLGDSVLSVIVAKHLYLTYRDIPEGELTKLRASLVCEKALDVFADKLELGKYLLLGKGEEMTGGRQRPSILADAVEAVIAALYLDGGYEIAQKFVLSYIPKKLDIRKVSPLADYKTALQEIIQQNREEKVEYVLVGERGPDHAKIFTAEVLLNSNVIGRGEGSSKKQAEQNAAREALKLMGYEL